MLPSLSSSGKTRPRSFFSRRVLDFGEKVRRLVRGREGGGEAGLLDEEKTQDFEREAHQRRRGSFDGEAALPLSAVYILGLADLIFFSPSLTFPSPRFHAGITSHRLRWA